MPADLIPPFFEKSLIGVFGVMCTALLSAIGFKIKDDKAFRKQIHKKLDDQAKYVAENHPNNQAFELMMENQRDNHKSIVKSIASLQTDVREIREKV